MLGTAVGDALGLPYEGLSAGRARRLLGPPNRHRLFLGRGMVSDDTEHTCMVAQSLIVSAGDLDSFLHSFAWRLRWWFLGLPAGIGLATLRSIVRLWIGFSPRQSGVFSAGNGPAMRAAILGAAVEDRRRLRDLVRVSTRVTHRDPKAEYGALAVALAARMACGRDRDDVDEFLNELKDSLNGEGNELVALITDAAASASGGQSTESFAKSLGLAKGVTGYVYHSVPVALHAWFAHPHDFRSAVVSVIECGGDTDSTAAIVGGIVGSAVGKAGIPADWLNHLLEWPRSVRWMERLARQLESTLASGSPARPVTLPVWGVLPRNVLFLLIVFYHGFRRLLPPYGGFSREA